MLLQFTKMQGLGNDFIVLDGFAQTVNLDAATVRRLADRHFGIGCDQVLVVERSQQPHVDFRYRIFNADGGEVQQCGNGARCFARFVHDRGMTQKTTIAVETAGGIIYPQIRDDGQVTVDMGPPRFQPEAIPFSADAISPVYTIDIRRGPIQAGVLSMGNPHAVIIVDSVAHVPVAELGTELESHPRFPERVNVGFMEVVNRNSIRLRVFERGAGETLACGTGACAAVVSGRQRGLLDDKVSVELPGGRLNIQWAGPDQPVLMTGPAEYVFEGTIQL